MSILVVELSSLPSFYAFIEAQNEFTAGKPPSRAYVHCGSASAVRIVTSIFIFIAVD